MVFMGLWVNITQVIFLCNVGTGRSRQYRIGYFLAKTCLRALGQHCKNNFLRNIAPAWSIQYFIYYFPHKSCLLATSQHYTSKNFVQCCPRGSRQHCTGRNHVQCCLNILNNIGTTSHR